MNKIIAAGLCFLPYLANVAKADHPTNHVETLQQQINDSKFFEKYKITNPSLCSTLIKYRTAAILRDIDHLYFIRTEAFKKIVSREVFETQLLNNVKMPTKIFYSDNQSIVTGDTAELNAYYLQTDGNRDYVIKSCDSWKFDAKRRQWSLVSNSLSWGSSIVK